MTTDGKYENMSIRQLGRMKTMFGVIRFRMNKDIKEGKLVSKIDVIENQNKIIEYFAKINKGIIASDTQVANMAFKSENEVREVLARQVKLCFLEMAYGELPFNSSESAKKVFREEIIKDINLDFNSLEEYKQEIIRLLETTEDIIRLCLDEIKDVCQLKIVIIFLTICNSIAELPKRDRRKIYDAKKSFVTNHPL